MDTGSSEINALTVETEQEKNLRETLAMLQGYTAAKEITRVDRIKAAVCGDQKTGKSSLIARTSRKPLLAYDFDDRRESIAGIDGVIIKTLIDIHSSEPNAWGKLESDIGVLEYQKSQGKLPFKSLMLDSMTFLRKYAENAMMKDTQGTLQRKAKIGIQDYLISQGWDGINYTNRMIEEMLRRVFALGIDIYCTFHTRPEKDKARSTKDNTVFTDQLTIEPQNLAPVLAMFNEVWRTHITSGGEFKLQVKPDYYFSASTVLNNLSGEEDQDIQKLLEKHNGTE